MPLKDDSPGERVHVIRRWEGGVTWMAHPDARMQRASHALTVEGDVWLFDPLGANGLDEELASLGTVAGVVLLSSRHGRHADRLAQRHDVSIHVPEFFLTLTSTLRSKHSTMNSTRRASKCFGALTAPYRKESSIIPSEKRSSSGTHS